MPVAESPTSSRRHKRLHGYFLKKLEHLRYSLQPFLVIIFRIALLFRKRNMHISTKLSLRLVVIVITMAICAISADARKKKRVQTEDIALPEVVESAYLSYSIRIDDEGDTITVFHLRDITIYPPQKFKNKKEEEFYWRTVRDVKLTLPYAKLIAETLIETCEYIETFPTQKEREDYLKQMEKALFEQYKPILKRFSKRQAKVLIKLVQRETHQTSYEIVKAFLGSFRATFWQGFGKLFGVSLKSEFQPLKDKNDATIERVAKRVEQGTL